MIRTCWKPENAGCANQSPNPNSLPTFGVCSLTSSLRYVQERNLGEDGVEKLLNTRKHKEVQGAWLEIGTRLDSYASFLQLLGSCTQELVLQVVEGRGAIRWFQSDPCTVLRE